MIRSSNYDVVKLLAIKILREQCPNQYLISHLKKPPNRHAARHSIESAIARAQELSFSTRVKELGGSDGIHRAISPNYFNKGNFDALMIEMKRELRAGKYDADASEPLLETFAAERGFHKLKGLLGDIGSEDRFANLYEQHYPAKWDCDKDWRDFIRWRHSRIALTTFRQFIDTAFLTDDPCGDLIMDIRHDENFPPQVETAAEVRRYLTTTALYRVALDAITPMFIRYRALCRVDFG